VLGTAIKSDSYVTWNATARMLASSDNLPASGSVDESANKFYVNNISGGTATVTYVAITGSVLLNAEPTWASLGTTAAAALEGVVAADVYIAPVVPGTSAGIVPAAGLPGNTTGNAIAAGYVGQVVSGTLTIISQGSPTADTYYDSAGTLTLEKGVWNIFLNTRAGGVNPGSISANTYPGVYVALRTGSTTIVETMASSGQVSGVSFQGCGSVNAVINITSQTVYKLSTKWEISTGSPTLGSIFAGGVGNFYAIRIA
jgi:hypothetical protein